MRLGSPIGAYRVAEVDDEVRYRLVGPCGTQHRALSLALTALLIHSRDRRTARRYVNAFRDFLNAVEVKHAGAADAFIAGVHDCRRTIDRYLVAMSVSIGVQKGPPIGVQKGPPSSSSVTGMTGAPFALVAA